MPQHGVHWPLLLFATVETRARVAVKGRAVFGLASPHVELESVLFQGSMENFSGGSGLSSAGLAGVAAECISVTSKVLHFISCPRAHRGITIPLSALTFVSLTCHMTGASWKPRLLRNSPSKRTL